MQVLGFFSDSSEQILPLISSTIESKVSRAEIIPSLQASPPSSIEPFIVLITEATFNPIRRATFAERANWFLATFKFRNA